MRDIQPFDCSAALCEVFHLLHITVCCVINVTLGTGMFDRLFKLFNSRKLPEILIYTKVTIHVIFLKSLIHSCCQKHVNKTK